MKAKKINEQLVAGQKIRLEFDTNEMDRFGRLLAYVYLTDKTTSINEQLLNQGAGKFMLDTVNLSNQNKLIAAAQKAHDNKTGLWSTCAPDPKIGCVVKGNMGDSGHRWYHLPEFRHYDQTNIRLDKADQWFCSEKEALKAGFTKARE
ncbi:thermonuclease family protein [Patescibacteria group bacterium]|nr:thermonuclease family protein [Patescibacteria group bacterium]